MNVWIHTIKMIGCVMCILLGCIRAHSIIPNHFESKTTIVTSVEPTNRKGIVELEGFGFAKNFDDDNVSISNFCSGILIPGELNDYCKSHGCIGDFKTLSVFKSSPKYQGIKGGLVKFAVWIKFI